MDRVKQIWVDADAIPNSVKEILFRAATREKVVVTLVANQWLKTPPSPYIKTVQVLSGFDEADNEIVRLVNPDDLVITADIPLADEVLEKGGQALNPRGYYYDLGSIKAQLTMRDFNETLRASGIQTKGPDALSARDRQDFANALDRWLRDYFRVE